MKKNFNQDFSQFNLKKNTKTMVFDFCTFIVYFVELVVIDVQLHFL